jgi:tRNA threonylcarbamoyl adenosine modification protein (Sua5/YciO/YrdC/YwlC family)
MIIEIHPDNPNPRGISKVIECLKDGGIIIYPTDTIYGLGCDIFQSKAVERIAKIKEIDLKKQNFSFICSDLSHLADYALPIDRSTYKIMKKALPGAYTFILKANSNIPKIFKIKKKTVGIRIPKHQIPLSIVNQLGNPLLTTSLKSFSNIEKSTDPYSIYETYKNQVDIVINGGVGNISPSTIIDFSKGEIEVIREGKGSLDIL